MYDFIQSSLAPYYLYIKLVHVPSALLWAFSVAMGYVNFLVPVMQAWRRDEMDTGRVLMRNWAFERFDAGVSIEHIAFPILVVSGILMIIVGGWGPESSWLVLKLSIVFAIVIPMEAIDYYISHGNGNKRFLREKFDDEDWQAYEVALHRHWWFLLVSTPMIMLVALFVIFLAIIKPIF